MWAGIIQDWLLGIPAIFAPERTLKAVKQRPTGDPNWTAFAALLVVLLSLSYIPGAQDPYRHRASAWLSVLSRPPGVLFFLLLRRRVYPIFGIIDAILFCVQAPLLFLTLRGTRERSSPAAKGTTRRVIEREALVAYSGSTFNEVKAVAFSGRYGGELPKHRGLGPTTFLRFLNDSARNLIDRRDVLPHFDKLIHANGITFTGVWRIDADSPYTGYFAKNSEGLLLARGSVAGPDIEAGKRRSYGIAGKVFPTMDPDEKVEPGNFVTVSKLSGEKHRHIADHRPTNAPPIGLDPAANFINRVLFRLMDTRPGWRQLYPVSTLGVPADAEVRTPDLMMLEVVPGTPRVDARDFREELRLEHYPDRRLTYAIKVKDWDDREWSRIGALEFDDYAIAEGGDKRIHFWIPRDVPSAK